MTRILGIDPGTHRVGWGIIEGPRRDPVVVAYGCLESPPHTEKAMYLQKIRRELGSILDTYQPTAASLETLLFKKNAKTAISVAEARGVIIEVLAARGLTLEEYAPNTIKATVAGTGRAGKSEVERMVSLLLRLNTTHIIDDTTDALAIALTAHARQSV